MGPSRAGGMWQPAVASLARAMPPLGLGDVGVPPAPLMPPCLLKDGAETGGWKVPGGAGDTPGCDEQLRSPSEHLWG